MGRTALECIDSLSCTACVLCLNPQLHHVGEGGGEEGGAAWRRVGREEVQRVLNGFISHGHTCDFEEYYTTVCSGPRLSLLFQDC